MRDWLMIALVALAGLAAAGLVARWRRRASERAPVVVDTAASRPTPARPAPALVGAASELPGEVPNTKILPHPEDMPLATLEFARPIGPVAVRQGEIVIGRHSSDDIRIEDVRVSRHHARLVARGEGDFEIHNLTAGRAEPNPMRVNGVVRTQARIDDGDVITLGGVSFTFRQAAA